MSNLKEKWRFGAWKELESDPGLFTLLVEEFGCRGVEVEEVYDLDSFDLHSGEVYGLIFLFKWANDQLSTTRTSSRRTREKEKNMEVKDVVNFDQEISKKICFAHQLIPNSCASHALLSVLLNCEKIQKGEFLNDLRSKLCAIEDPEIRGHALGNLPELAIKHNKFACYEPPCLSDLSGNSATSALATGETFHYCCYIPNEGNLYELDGLKSWPINHGAHGSHWLEKAKQVISERIAKAREKEQGCHDIRYNLMSVVPNKKMELEKKYNELKNMVHNCQVPETEQQLCDDERREVIKIFDNDFGNVMEIKNDQKQINAQSIVQMTSKLKSVLQRRDLTSSNNSSTAMGDYINVRGRSIRQLALLKQTLKDEENKHRRYEKDAERRSHNYGNFIRIFLEKLHQNGTLNDVIEVQRLQKPKSVPIRSRRRSKKMDT